MFKKKKALYYRNEEAINLVHKHVDGFAKYSNTVLSLLRMKNISLLETVINQKMDTFIRRINP